MRRDTHRVHSVLLDGNSLQLLIRSNSGKYYDQAFGMVGGLDGWNDCHTQRDFYTYLAAGGKDLQLADFSRTRIGGRTRS
jgi:hypothetical protein